MKYLVFLLSMFCVLPASVRADQLSDNSLINSLSAELTDRKTSESAIDKIIASSDVRKRVWLEALLDGKMYLQKSDKLMVIANRTGKQYEISDAETNELIGTVKKRTLRKVSINNNLRKKLRSAIAGLALEDADPRARLEAVQRMMLTLEPDQVAALETLQTVEQDSSVQQALELALAIHDLDSTDEIKQLQGLEKIGGNTSDTAVNRLQSLASGDPASAVTVAAAQQLEKTRKRIALYDKAETLFFGLSLGSVLAMAAVGLAISFGVMGVINMAHGEMIMLGAYTTWLIQMMWPAAVEYSLIFAIPAAFMVSFSVGIVIERLVIRHLYGRPLETLLATFGISLILQQAVRTFISPQNVPVANPSWMSGSWVIDPAFTLAYNRLYILFFSIAVFLLLLWILNRTFFGLKVRAVAQNRDMARAMGAASTRIDMYTFGLGAGIAGVAGVALSQLTNVGPNLGQSYIIDSFMVVVFGGVGNLWGTLFAGLSLGVLNKVLEPWAGAVLAKILVLVFIILFIQRYPRGLFPQRGRAAAD